jgi:hypothetical protein
MCIVENGCRVQARVDNASKAGTLQKREGLGLRQVVTLGQAARAETAGRIAAGTSTQEKTESLSAAIGRGQSVERR